MNTVFDFFVYIITAPTNLLWKEIFNDLAQTALEPQWLKYGATLASLLQANQNMAPLTMPQKTLD